jgi:hypothetical protein
MTTFAIISGLCLVLGLVLFTLRPLLEARQTRRVMLTAAPDQELENLLFEREATLTAIRDLQFDRAMGKLSEADFAELDARYRARAVAILQRLDALGAPSADAEEASEAALDAWIEQAVAAARQTSAAPAVSQRPSTPAAVSLARFCTTCGTQARPGDRFCASCGKALVVEPAPSLAQPN